MSLQIAVIGAGPSGFYTAASLLRESEECRIDFIEALPTPYGLIRGGVAPDHQSTKGVSRVFAKTARDPRVGYYGNVAVGRDITLDELGALYDAVVIAAGAPLDRPLAIPGSDAAGVYGSAAFVGWYNGHPDFRDLNPDLNTSAVAVIGHGNVAIDIARVLVKTPAEMADSDLAAHAAAAIHQAPIKDVYIIGRRGPVEAKFTNKELKEMGALADCMPVVDRAQLPIVIDGEMSDHARVLRQKNLATLREYADRPAGNEHKRVHFVFCSKPVEVLGGGQVEGVRMERMRVEAGRAFETGETFDIPCGLVVSAIGYRMPQLAGAPGDETSGVVASNDGRVGDGLYVVGWAKRGPSGVIGTNKADGRTAARQILKDISESGRAGGQGLENLLSGRKVVRVSFEHWLQIDAAETAAAQPGAPRKKFTRIADMLGVIGNRPAKVLNPAG